MPVRKTESRLPANIMAADLGQTASGTNPNIFLVSYLSAPVVQMRIQDYFVFVTDNTVASTIATYNWAISDNGTVTNISTTTGVMEFTPQNKGTLTISVKLMNASSTLIDTVNLIQAVVSLNTALEVLVDQQDKNFPSAAHPATSREAINDLRMYADALLPPAQNNLFNKFLLSAGYATAMATQQVQRNYLLESYANLINTGRHADLLSATDKGIGICKVRPQVLAMFLEKTPNITYTPFVELPTSATAKKATLTTIQNNFNALPENDKIDIFNVLRFPKTNYKVAKLVFEKLKDKYFSTSTIPQILGVKADTQKLVAQYETGPAAGILSATTFAKAVFNIMQQQVWAIPAVPMAGAAPAAGPSGAAAAPFGSPEHVPQLTFVAQPRETDNGFIRNAFVYHDSYGLAPVLVASFEDLVTRLSQQNTPITRLRIVSHFTFDPTAASGMNMSFFTPPNPAPAGGQNRPFTIKEYFKFGISDAEGQAALVAEYFRRNSEHLSASDDLIQIDFKQPVVTRSPIIPVILKLIRASPNAAVLTPFALQGATSKPSGKLKDFIQYCCDLIYVATATMQIDNAQTPGSPINMPPQAITAITSIITTKLNATGAALVNATVTQQQITALQNAIAAVPLSSFPIPNPSFGTFFLLIDGEYLRNHNTFRTQLATVKNRFTSASVIDIRGCRVGLEPEFMAAVKEFFGNAGSLPTVTAPDWFQSFPTLGFNFTNTESGIDGFFNSGKAPAFSNTDVQREYSNWSGRIGIPSHLAFWQQLANGEAFDFLVFQWKNSIPGLGLPAVKITGFGALAFTAAIKRLGEIFNISANVPSDSELTAFETNILPQLANLKSAAASAQVMTAATTLADLTPVNASVQQVKTALGQTLPAVPNPLTLAYITTSIQTLKAFVNSKLVIDPFLQALKAKLNAPTAGIRYLTAIGLPLPVQSANSEQNVSLVMLDAMKDDAVKAWVKGQWAETVPGAAAFNALTFTWNEPTHVIPNEPGKNDDDLTSLGKVLQTASLSSNHESTELAINPTYEYQQHIKTTA